MTFKLGTSSLAKLKGVHPDLVRVVKRAILLTKVDFRITCGLRTLDEQKVLVRTGKSRTLKSRHLPGKDGLSHAVDVVALTDGDVSWEMPYYVKIAAAFKEAAKLENVQIEWGGEIWKGFVDAPHFQLPWAIYPK